MEGAEVPFDDTKGHKFVYDGFQMIVTHERRFLDLIERILERLDADHRQVEIETKFLEVQEGALDEVSFDWQYSWGDAQYVLDPTVVDSNGQPVISLEKFRILAHWHRHILLPGCPEILLSVFQIIETRA